MKALFFKLTSLLLVFTFMFILTSCGGSDGVNMSFSYPIPSEPSTLDPQVCSGMAAETAVANLFEGLVRIGENGAIVPGAAEKMDVSSDGLVYTFRLRSGLKWHLTGKFSDILGEDFEKTFDAALAAKDFVFGFRRALSPSTSSPGASSLYAIKNAKEVRNGELPATSLGVAAADAHTLIITLSSKCADFLSLLTEPVSMPCNETFFNACKGKYGKGLSFTLCNGPFYLSKWTSGSSLLMKKNADYTGTNKALPSSVTLYINHDESSYVKKVSDGVYDAAIGVTAASIQADSAECNVFEFQNTVWGLCFNCGDDVLSNRYIRLALCGSFEASKLGLAENHVRAKGLLPSCCRIGGENYREKAGSADFVAYNHEKASDYWKAGLDDLGLSSVTVTVMCTPENEYSVRKLLQYWQQSFGISIKAKADAVELSSLKKSLKDGKYQVALAPVTVSSASAAICLAEYSPESGKNIFSYASETYADIIANAFRSGSAASTAEGCRIAESFLMQNGAFYPLYESSEFLTLAKGVSGIVGSPDGNSVCFASAVKLN